MGHHVRLTMPRPRLWALLALAVARASLPPLPKDPPPQTVGSHTNDLTLVIDDELEVFDAVDEAGPRLLPAPPFDEPADTAVIVYRQKKDVQVPTNWTVQALEELVTRTPFLSSEGTIVFTGKLLSDVVSDDQSCPPHIICAAEDNSKALIERRTWTLEALDRASGELLWRATASRLGDAVSSNTSSAVASPKKPPLFATVSETAAAVAACAVAAFASDATALVPLDAAPAVFCPPPARFFSLTALLVLMASTLAAAFGAHYARKNRVERVPRIVVDKTMTRVGSGFFGATRVDVQERPVRCKQSLAQEVAALQRADHAAVLRFYACDVLPSGVAQIAVEASLGTLEDALATHPCAGLPPPLRASLKSLAEALAWLRDALPESGRWRATPDRIVLVPRGAGDLWAAHELKLVPRDGGVSVNDVRDLQALAARCVGSEGDDARRLELQNLAPCCGPLAWTRHPALWAEHRRVAFLLDASDYVEETADAQCLRDAIDAAPGFDGWRAAFSDAFLQHAEARRTYDGRSVRALLRMLRNQSSHVHASPFADTREGLLAFVLDRYPALLLRVFEACRRALPARAPADLRAYLGYFDRSAPALDGVPRRAATPPLAALAEAPLSRHGSPTARAAVEAPTRLEEEAPAEAPAPLAPTSDAPPSRRGSESPPTRDGSPRGIQSLDARGDQPLPTGYRTRLCKHWLASGGTTCPMTARGLQCKFAHGEEELNAPDAPPPAVKKRRPRRKSSSPRPAPMPAPDAPPSLEDAPAMSPFEAAIARRRAAVDAAEVPAC